MNGMITRNTWSGFVHHAWMPDGIRETIEAKIMEAEASVQRWQEQMADPKVMADATKLHEVCAALAVAEEQVKTLYGRWEFLENKLKA